MDQFAKKTFLQVLPDGVPAERRINGIGPQGIPYGDAAKDTMNRISTEELRQRNESLLENIGALRFSIARIELLEEQKTKYRQALTEINALFRTQRPEGDLCRAIDRLLDETE